jgi:hypothetical protein
VYNNAFGPIVNSGTDFYLDVQELELPSSGLNSFIGGYLNSVTVTSASGERILFSGLTLQTASTATPEPGTILLFTLGLAGVVFFKVRRSRNAA